ARGPVDPEIRLTDLLRIRHAGIRNASLEFDPADGESVMLLSDIGSGLDATPVPGAAGWYQFSATLKRETLVDAGIDGRINIDTGELALEPLRLTAELNAERYHLFPPAIQSWLNAHAVQGNMKLEARGRLPLGDHGERSLKLAADFSKISF